MGKIRITKVTKYRKSKTSKSGNKRRCKTCGRFMQGSDIVNVFELTKQEVKEIKDKIYLTDIQEKILDMKLQGNLTEVGMAMELGVSESTITYQWKKVKKKILKVI